jgi:hypothetical protein
MATYIGRDTSKLKSKGGKWKYGWPPESLCSPIISVKGSTRWQEQEHPGPTSMYALHAH